MKETFYSRSDLPLRYTQNFLRSTQLVKKLVQSSSIQAGQTVLEIGPGKGIITSHLAEAVGPQGKVIAVEYDAQLAKDLRAQFHQLPQVEIVQQDILQFSLEALKGKYSVFANIPFHITGQILEHLFSPDFGPKNAWLILQKEALIDPRSGKLLPTLKSLLIQPWYDIEAVHAFSPADFSPAPSIDTALFCFTQKDVGLVTPHLSSLYKDFVSFISSDRVGEGSWKRLFPRNRKELIHQHKLVSGKGLKAQTFRALLEVFHNEILPSGEKQKIIHGAFQKLRQEQKRRESQLEKT